MDTFTNRLNMGSVISELDDILSKNRYDDARVFLEEQIIHAQQHNDNKGLFTLYNECIGLYRKIGDRENCYKYCRKALESVIALNLENHISGATTYINCGTAYKAFGEAPRSIVYFEKALALYEKLLPLNDRRLAGLYNNYALSLVDLKEYEKALFLYNKAISVLDKNPRFNLEQAVTYLNMANALEAQKGLTEACEEIDVLLNKAEKVLNENLSEDDGNYAFVCEKCAPTFGYYGRFLYEKELTERARKIYERS
ncbi:MAG: tetratricopeptide repeat protein [Acutalibacteraceae bacterium]